jgi:hypothetical protein
MDRVAFLNGCMDILLLLFLVLFIFFLIVILISLFIQCLSAVLIRQSRVDGSLGRIDCAVLLLTSRGLCVDPRDRREWHPR